jgi:uncharacterized protein YndB with AHSA1/START domain
MNQKKIQKKVTVSTSVADVWQAWTTPEGALTFFAPKANVELKIGGRYEMLFNPDEPPGSQGGEGLKILSYLPQEMLSFTWNAPPKYPTVRNQHTWVVVQFEPVDADNTRVKLTHLGWQNGGEWDQVFDYFVQAWDVVLGRLQYLFENGPVDWDAPYNPSVS